MKICLFQGTFNPIHNAHLRIAKYALKYCDVDKILFIPAYKPPHKCEGNILPIHRLNMVKAAIKSIPQFEVSDIEYKRSDKSYTFVTLCELHKLYQPDNRFKFLIGTDAFKHIKSWYESDKLKELVEFILFSRDKNFDKEHFDMLKSKGYDYTYMPLEFLDISSTEIRHNVKLNKNINELVPKEVEDYIKKNDLYKN